MKSGYPVEGTPELQERFRSVWYHLDALAAPSFSEVVARYSEPHRPYHTLEHISEGYRWLDATRHLAEHSLEVELALMYHDIVCEPSRSDNERLSASLFRDHARAAGLGARQTDRICTSIEATATHGLDFGDTALLCDIDLPVLGAPPARYAEYER